MFIILFLDMQRFQVAYNLKEIPEVREYLDNALEQSKQGGDLQDLYRRRLVICALHLSPRGTYDPWVYDPYF